MPIRSIAEAKDVFSQYSDGIHACVIKAREKYFTKFGTGLSHLETSTKRSMMRDLIVDELRAYAEKTSGVQFFKDGNLKCFGFNSEWYLRVKHVDEKFRVGVSPTEDSRSYDRNVVPEKIVVDLIGKEPTALYLGWHATENAPLSPQVSLVCNNDNGEVEWVFPISGDGLPPVLDLPVHDAGGGTSTRVRVKKTEKITENNG